MATLGRSPGAAPLTSVDIPDNSITAAKIVADTIAAGDIATGAVDTAELASGAVTDAKLDLTTPALGTPASGVVTNLSGVLPVGVTGGSGLTALGTVTAGTLGNNAFLGNERVRTSPTSPDSSVTITGSDSFSAANIALLFSTGAYWGGASALEHTLVFDYGSGNTKYISKVSFIGDDTYSANTGYFFEASNDGVDATFKQTLNEDGGILKTFGAATRSFHSFLYTTTSTTGYRYYRLRSIYSSSNNGKISHLRIIERDVSTLHRAEIGGATFPAGHVINTWKWGPYAYTTEASSSISSTLATLNFGVTRGGDMEITDITATEGNLLQIIAHPGDLFISNDGSYNTDIGPEIDGTWYSTTSVYFYKSTDFIAPTTSTQLFLVPASFSNKTIKMRAAKQGGSGTHYMSTRSFQGAQHSIHMTVFEIQQ